MADEQQRTASETMEQQPWRPETLSALSLFQQDATEQLSGGHRTNRQSFYQQLLSRLYTELNDTGASLLLDQLCVQLLKEKKETCPMLLYSAVTECYQMLVLDVPMADYTHAVPEVFVRNREPMTWEELASYPADPELPVRATFPTRVRVLKSVSRLLHQARQSQMTPDEGASVLERQLMDYREAMTLQDAALTNARAQVDALQAQIRELRAGMADRETQRMMDEKMANFQAELARKNAESAEAGRAVFQEAFAEQQKAIRLRMEDESRWASQLFADAGHQYDRIRQEIAQMQEAQRQRMLDWQAALYRADYRMLGQCYVGMFTTLQDAMDHAVTQVISPSMSPEEARPLLDLRATILSQLTRLEYAMKRLGLLVIRPEHGEDFQSDRHTLLSTSSQSSEVAQGAKIDRCLTPGVMMESENPTFQEVIVPAVVTLVMG